MPAIEVATNRLPRAHTGEAVAPTRPDGMPWRFELLGDATRVYADTAGDLFEVMRPGYVALPETGQVRWRIEHAVTVATQLRAEHVAAARDRGIRLTGAELDELLRSPRDPAEVTVWVSDVPLVLLTVHYRPYTDRPAPTSAIDPDAINPRNLVWLRPGHPEAYLRSLAVAGAVRLAEHVEA